MPSCSLKRCIKLDYMLETPAKLLVLVMINSSKNQANRDNQQITLHFDGTIAVGITIIKKVIKMLTETEKAWLAGFIDADGCIRLKKGMKNSKKDQNCLVPHVSIHNVCCITLNRCAELIGKVIPNYTTGRKVRVKKEHSTMHVIEFLGMKRCEIILPLIEPYLITKKLEAILLLEFIKTRNEKLAVSKQANYSEREYKLYSAIKYLKKTRHLRDYMPSIDEILNEDIVRTDAKALEVAEMSTRLTKEEQAEIGKNLRWYRKEYRSEGQPEARSNNA